MPNVDQGSRFVDFIEYKKDGVNVDQRTVLADLHTDGVSYGGMTIRKASGSNITISVFVSYQKGLPVPSGVPPASWTNYGWLKDGNDITVSSLSEIKIDRPYRRIAIMGVRAGASTTTADIAVYLTNRA